MILYSIIPVEIVFGLTDQKVKYMETEYLGEKIEVAQLDDKNYVITRLLSTRPSSFLNPKLQPGNIISDIKPL